MGRQYLLVEVPDTMDLSEDETRGIMLVTASKDKFHTVCETNKSHLLRIDDVRFSVEAEGGAGDVTFPGGVTRLRKMEPLSLSEMIVMSGEAHRLLTVQSLLGHMKASMQNPGGSIIRP